MVTRQALKTLLNYLSETNGELHLWLHNYISDHPLPLDGRVDADEWIVALSASPLTKVQDPARSSVVSPAALEAVLHGEREVSPRWAAGGVRVWSGRGPETSFVTALPPAPGCCWLRALRASCSAKTSTSPSEPAPAPAPAGRWRSG